MNILPASANKDARSTVSASSFRIVYQVTAAFLFAMMMNPETGVSRFEISEIGKIDPTIVFAVDKMNVGDYLEPALFTTHDGKQAYRLLYLKSRTEPHKANLKDDYQRIQAAALNEKQEKMVNEWIKKKRTVTYVNVVDDFKNCKFDHGWMN